MALELCRPDSPNAFYRTFGFLPEALGVWLTESPHAEDQCWTYERTDKVGVRLTVEVDPPALVPWGTLAQRHGVPPPLYAMMDESGGTQSALWWIHAGGIPPERILATDILSAAPPVGLCESEWADMLRRVQSEPMSP